MPAQMPSVREGEPDECPRCRHGHVARRGRAKDGPRRWPCRGCGRTFGAGTLGPLARPKPAPGVWAYYAERMVAGESPRGCADPCGACLETPWLMRTRACEAMRNALAPLRGGAGPSVRIDERCLGGSLCGDRGRARARMPGEAHAGGSSVHEGTVVLKHFRWYIFFKGF